MSEPLATIAAVERETGISKDSLRVWERRYQFPQPQRDAAGERLYPVEQVAKLRLIKRLLDRGYRAGRLVPATVQSLQALLEELPATASNPLHAASQELAPYLDALRAHQVDELRRMLAQALLRMGLGPGVLNLIAPLIHEVGELWMRGELQVFEEHIFSESVQQVLRQAMQAVPPAGPDERPRVLLTTLPGEPHGLGLAMAEALFVLGGCQCLSLGVQTPAGDVVMAAAAHRADIVALSFSAYAPAAGVAAALSDLRQVLPAQVELWVGGSSAALRRRSAQAGLHHVTDLGSIERELQRWRDASRP